MFVFCAEKDESSLLECPLSKQGNRSQLRAWAKEQSRKKARQNSNLYQILWETRHFYRVCALNNFSYKITKISEIDFWHFVQYLQDSLTDFKMLYHFWNCQRVYFQDAKTIFSFKHNFINLIGNELVQKLLTHPLRCEILDNFTLHVACKMIFRASFLKNVLKRHLLSNHSQRKTITLGL